MKYIGKELKGRFIYLGGVSGSGKTTLGLLMSDGLENCLYFNSGDIKRPESRRRFGVGLSTLGQERSMEMSKWMLSDLYNISGKNLKIVDTHYMQPLQDSSFVKLFPEESISYIDLFVLIEADAQEVLNRRVSRGDGQDSIDIGFVKEELAREKEEAVRLSEKFSIPLMIFNNNADLETAAYDFKNSLNEHKFSS